jgi:D-alanyl-lipoteichoic acid acyltransferase DltB (MBOAT superfamily)
MLEFIVIMVLMFVILVLAVIVNRNLIYLSAIAINFIILATLDYSQTQNTYLAFLVVIMLLILGVKFYEHYRD